MQGPRKRRVEEVLCLQRNLQKWGRGIGKTQNLTTETEKSQSRRAKNPSRVRANDTDQREQVSHLSTEEKSLPAGETGVFALIRNATETGTSSQTYNLYR